MAVHEDVRDAFLHPCENRGTYSVNELIAHTRFLTLEQTHCDIGHEVTGCVARVSRLDRTVPALAHPSMTSTPSQLSSCSRSLESGQHTHV